MADISKITTPNGTVYNLKDAQARSDITALQSAIAGGVTFMGETTTPLTDGATTTTIVINGNNVTALKGYLVIYNSKEFVFDGTKWIELGDLSVLGTLAWKNSASAVYTPAGSITQPTFTGSSASVTISTASNASGNYTPAGSISQPTFSGSSFNSTGSFTPTGTVSLSTQNKTAAVSTTTGTVTYTPTGTVAAPTISVSAAGATTIVNSITNVGTLPSLLCSVTNENLTFSWDAGTLPSKGANVTVKTGDATYSATAPAFTGNGVRLVTGNIAVPTTATFSGTSSNITVSGTPTGTVSTPTFTGTKVQISGYTTASGTVSKPTFSGTQDTIIVS